MTTLSKQELFQKIHRASNVAWQIKKNIEVRLVDSQYLAGLSRNPDVDLHIDDVHEELENIIGEISDVSADLEYTTGRPNVVSECDNALQALLTRITDIDNNLTKLLVAGFTQAA